MLDLILEHPITSSPQIGVHDERLLLADATAALEEAEYVLDSGWLKTRGGYAVDVTMPDRVFEQLESDVDEDEQDDGEDDEPGQQLFFEDNLALVHWSPWCEHSDLLPAARENSEKEGQELTLARLVDFAIDGGWAQHGGYVEGFDFCPRCTGDDSWGPELPET